MSGVEGGTLAEVLAAHEGLCCTMGVWSCYDCGGVLTSDHREVKAAKAVHLAAAVQTWLSERLGSEEVREAVAVALYGYSIDGENGTSEDAAEVAIDAIKAAITEEGKSKR